MRWWRGGLAVGRQRIGRTELAKAATVIMADRSGHLARL
jgi:hypothetical protein